MFVEGGGAFCRIPAIVALARSAACVSSHFLRAASTPTIIFVRGTDLGVSAKLKPRCRNVKRKKERKKNLGIFPVVVVSLPHCLTFHLKG